MCIKQRYALNIVPLFDVYAASGCGLWWRGRTAIKRPTATIGTATAPWRHRLASRGTCSGWGAAMTALRIDVGTFLPAMSRWLVNDGAVGVVRGWCWRSG